MFHIRRPVRLVGLLLAVGATAGLAVGCTAESGTSASAPAFDAAGPAETPGGRAEDQDAGAGESQSQGGPRAGQITQPGVDRKLVRTATLELTAAEVLPVTGKARDLVIAAGGYAGSEDVRAEYASVVLLVPSDRFDRVVGDLSALVPVEQVRSRSQTAQDVTEQLVDLDSRVATQRASVQRIRALLARAATVDEITRIESELTSREAELESLQRRRESLGGQVAMSTITLRVTRVASTEPVADSADAGGFLDGLRTGWDWLLVVGGGVLRLAGLVLPFAVLLGLPGYFLARRWRRRRTPVVQGQQAG